MPSAWSADGSGLQLSQPIGQHPQRPVEADVLVNALNGAGALGAPIALASRQAALDQVLLRTVEQRPQIRTPVVETTRHEDLLLSHRRRLVRVETQTQRGTGEHFRLAC